MKGSCDSMPHLATESFLTKEQQDRIKGTFDDFVAVVRCKDCIEYREWGEGKICMRLGSYYGDMKPDFFCAYGKRVKTKRS